MSEEFVPIFMFAAVISVGLSLICVIDQKRLSCFSSGYLLCANQVIIDVHEVIIGQFNFFGRKQYREITNILMQ